MNKFIGECIYCKEKSSHEVPRPFGKQIFSRARNEVVSFDYLYIGPSEDGFERLLVVTDKLTSFTRLYLAKVEDAASAAHSLLDWMSTYGAPERGSRTSHPRSRTRRCRSSAKRWE